MQRPNRPDLRLLRVLGAWLACAFPLGAASCDRAFPEPATAAAAADAVVDADTGPVASAEDVAVPDSGPDAAAPDGGPDAADAIDAAPDCTCPIGQVMRVGACVPTPELGCGPTCVAKSMSACPAQASCDQEAAHQPCQPDVAQPTCVPGQAMGFGQDALRLQPTAVAAGAEVDFEVRGGDYHIGALMWWMRVGDEASLADEYGPRCVLRGKWKAKEAGVFPVMVGYGGGAGDAMNKGWSLAGFVGVGGAPVGVQPGFVCSAASPCQSGGGWSCGCTAGRCQCEPPP